MTRWARRSRWRSDSSGATAVEFALIGLPFLLICIAILGYGVYIFSNSMLEQAVETAARKIRTGEVNAWNESVDPDTGETTYTPMTQEQFKNLICGASVGVIECNKLTVHVQSGPDWSAITPTPCLDTNSDMTAQGGVAEDSVTSLSGGANQVVVVTACYEWVLAQSLPFLMLSNMSNNSAVIQAVSTFRSEPYS